MSNEVATTSTAFVLPNRDALKKNSGRILQFAIIGLVGFILWSYMLPFVLAVLAGTIEAVIGAAVIIATLLILFNPKVWRAVRYGCQFVATKILSIAINMDPFGIMYEACDEKDKDLDEVDKQLNNITGQRIANAKDVAQANNDMRVAKQEMLDAQNLIRNAKSQAERDDATLKLADVTADYNNAMDTINQLQPLVTDLSSMELVFSKISKQGRMMLKIVRKNIDSLKKRNEAASAGAKAIGAGRRALSGNSAIDADALTAKTFIEKDIALKLGTITQGIDFATKVLSDNDFKDAAKIKLALKDAEDMDISAKFNYSDTVTSSDLHLTDGQKSVGNQYLSYLTDNK